MAYFARRTQYERAFYRGGARSGRSGLSVFDGKASNLSIKVQGIDELIRRFERLDQKVQRQIVNKAGLPILKDIRHTARYYMIKAFGTMRRSGKFVGFNMAESLGFKRSSRRGFTTISLVVLYQKAKTNKLAHLIEWGFRHPSGKQIAGHTPMSRAFDEHKDIAAERFRLELRRMLDQAEGGMRVS